MTLNASQYAAFSMDCYIRPEATPSQQEIPFGFSVWRSFPLDTGFNATVYCNADESEVVIAYRGTDDPLSDASTGFQTAFGWSFASPQAAAAKALYDLVIDRFENADVSLTGHSLGGGLAGLVGSLNNVKAYVFDAMPFAASALVQGGGTAYFEAVHGYHIVGEALELVRAPSPIDTELSHGFSIGDAALDPGPMWEEMVARHDISALAIRVFFAEMQDVAGTVAWSATAGHIFEALFNDANSTTGGLGNHWDDSVATAATIRDKLAYTNVIGMHGSSDLFADASRLGEVGSGNISLVGGLADIAVQYAGHWAFTPTIASGDYGVLSVGDGYLSVDVSSETWFFLNGFQEVPAPQNYGATLYLFNALIVEAEVTLDVSLISGMLNSVSGFRFAFDSPSQIQEPVGLASDVINVGTSLSDTIIGSIGNDIVFAGSTGSSAGDSVHTGSGHDWAFGSANADIIDGGDDSDILFGGGGEDYIYGGTDLSSDFLHGDGGIDHLYGGDGSDTLDGGEGDDHLDGGAGEDVIIGGAGVDTAIVDRTFESSEITSWGGYLRVNGDKLQGIEKLQFAGGNVMTVEDAWAARSHGAPLIMEGTFASGAVVATFTANVIGDLQAALLDHPLLRAEVDGPTSYKIVTKDACEIDFETIQSFLDLGIQLESQAMVDGPNGPHMVTFYSGEVQSVYVDNAYEVLWRAPNSPSMIYGSDLNVGEGGVDRDAGVIDISAFSVPFNVDAMHPWSFRIVGHDGSALDTFSIARITDHSARINYLGNVDFEQRQSFSVTIEATDGVETFQQTLAIAVLDLNEAPTDINMQIAVSETDLTGIAVGLITSVRDQDAGDTHALYQVGSDSPFALVNGNQIVLVRRPTQHEVEHGVTFSVRANDSGNAKFTKEFHITFVDTDPGVWSGSSASENMQATNLDDVVSAGAGNDVVYGADGNDTVYGGTGNDQIHGDHYYPTTIHGADHLYGGDGNDVIFGQGGFDFLYGEAGSDELSGGDGDDNLYGGIGNDILIGGDGADVLDGGDGTDLVKYDYVSTSVTVNAAANLVIVTGASADFDLLFNIEGYIGSNGNDTFYGSNDADHFEGGNGDDTFHSSLGADRFVGGGGTDTASYANAAARVTIDLTRTFLGQLGAVGGVETGDILNSIERVIGSNFDDIFKGGTGVETLFGGNGNDTFLGSLGADSLQGAAGTDTADYSASNAAINVNLASSLGQSGGHAQGDLLSSIENLIGSAYADTILGSSLANTLAGGAGADYLDGAGGIDLIDYSGSDAGVNVNLSNALGHTGGHAAGDTLLNVENIRGSAFDDALTGTATANVFFGSEGADAIDGLGGTDLVDYQFSDAAVTVNLGSATAQSGGHAAGDVLSNIENLRGSGYDDTLTGSSASNTIYGGFGDDSIVGGSGVDYLYGDDGNDTLDGSAGNDFLYGGAGADTFRFGGSGQPLPPGFGTDTIIGWESGDTIDFYGNAQSLARSYADTNYGGYSGLMITVGSVGGVFLRGITYDDYLNA